MYINVNRIDFGVKSGGDKILQKEPPLVIIWQPKAGPSGKNLPAFTGWIGSTHKFRFYAYDIIIVTIVSI